MISIIFFSPKWWEYTRSVEQLFDPMKWENLLIGWRTDENAMIFWDKFSHAHSPIRPLSFDFMLVAHVHANHMCVSSFIAFMQITLWISTLTLTSSSCTDTRMSLLHQIIYHICMAATLSLHNVCHNRCINKFERCTFFSNHIICVCYNKFTCSTLGLRWIVTCDNSIDGSACVRYSPRNIIMQNVRCRHWLIQLLYVKYCSHLTRKHF